MTEPIKYIDPKEFRELGFLQEANRLFFHPLGLAMEVVVHEDGTEEFGGVWDYRDDPEGMIFGDKPDAGKAAAVAAEKRRRRSCRVGLMGTAIQPLDWDPTPSLSDLEPHGNPMGTSPHTE